MIRNRVCAGFPSPAEDLGADRIDLAKLLVVHVTRAEVVHRVAPDYMMLQMSTLATIERDAFVPSLFTGTTTLHPRAAMRSISDTPQGKGIHLADLVATLEGRPGITPSSGVDNGQAYWRNWPADFDHVLWQHFGAAPDVPLPVQLEPIAIGQVFSLYRILKE